MLRPASFTVHAARRSTFRGSGNSPGFPLNTCGNDGLRDRDLLERVSCRQLSSGAERNCNNSAPVNNWLSTPFCLVLCRHKNIFQNMIRHVSSLSDPLGLVERPVNTEINPALAVFLLGLAQ